MKTKILTTAIFLTASTLFGQIVNSDQLSSSRFNQEGWPCEGYDIGWSYYYPYHTDTLIQNIPFGVDWSINIENPMVLEGENTNIYTGDVNGDGLLEIVYTSNNIVYVIDGNGNELWNVSLGLADEFRHNIIEDVTGDGIPEIIIGAKVNSTLKLLFYDGYGNLIKEITENEQVGQYDYIQARAVTDIDNDGDLEVVFWRLWGFDSWSRGIGVFDYNSGKREWFYPIGPNIRSLSIVDITGDPNKEILTGTIGPCNGHNINGFSDCSCYAICWDKDGNLLWSRQFEGSGFVNARASVNDLDGDGKNEVIYTSWGPGFGRIFQLNPDNGEIMKEFNPGRPVSVNGFANIAGDDNKEILVTSWGPTQTGGISIFDNSLNLLSEYVVPGSYFRVCAINDLNGDGELEIIMRKSMFDELAVLDHNLNELWSLEYNDAVLDVIPADLNNDGINELVVSTAHKLQVREWRLGPSFNTVLNDQVACKDDHVTFEVLVEGIPPINYQWQQDGVNIPGATDSILILTQVQPEDDGKYCCIATNDYGSDTSNTATLSVEFAIPTNITGPVNVVEYQAVLYSVAMQEGHTYEFMVEGGNQIDGTENSIKVHWGTAGQGQVKLLETSELGCTADTNILNVTIGTLGIDDKEVQNLAIYPNPCSSATQIRFTIYDERLVISDLFEISGVRVKRLLNELRKPGTYEMEIDLSDLPAGMYFVRLHLGNEVITRKLVKIND
jgi:hypothetical protein